MSRGVRAERIAGRLQVWLLGRRRTGREPSGAAVEARRAALLAEPVPTDSGPAGSG